MYIYIYIYIYAEWKDWKLKGFNNEKWTHIYIYIYIYTKTIKFKI